MQELTTAEILMLSMRVSLIATAIIALVGTPVSYFMVRHRNVTSRLLESLLSLPLVIPPVVTGYFLLVILGPTGFLGSRLEAFGFRIALDWKGAVVASSVIAFPLYLAVANAVFQKCDKRLEDAAKLARIAIGPTDFAIALYDDAAFVHELMDRMEEYTLPLIECVLEYPVDALWTTGPVCMNQGPMFSPQIHNEFILPRIEKMMELVRPSGVPVVLHADGDVSAFLDWIIATKFAGLHPIEPGDGRLDIYELKERYGERICLCGNIDNAGVLTNGTADEVRADVLEHLECLSSGGGYVCGSSHEITDITSFENFRALAETICSYKRKT